MAKVERNHVRQVIPDEVDIFIKVKEGIKKAHPPVKKDELITILILSVASLLSESPSTITFYGNRNCIASCRSIC